MRRCLQLADFEPRYRLVGVHAQTDGAHAAIDSCRIDVVEYHTLDGVGGMALVSFSFAPSLAES